MIPHSLRLRLILAFMAIVGLLLAVAVASFTINQRIQIQVKNLRSSLGVDLRRIDLQRVGLEIEGYWDPSGTFVATDVEVLPGQRRPKLRGAIQDVDPDEGTVTMYGRTIRVTPETEFDVGDAGLVGADALRPGHRIEVTCEVVDDDVWRARKVRTDAVKDSDKIKGTATAVDLDGVAPETLAFHGLLVSVAPSRDEAPESALRRIETATHMTLALQQCRTVARVLLGRTDPLPELDEDLEPDIDTRVPTSVQDRLLRAEQDFDHYLTRARAGERHGERHEAEPYAPDASTRWVRLLVARRPELRQHIDTLLQLSQSDPEAARAHLDEQLDPLIVDGLLPVVHALLSRSEEDLGDQLRSLQTRSATTTRLALVTSGVAMLTAVVLGLLVWRSIHRPIVALHDAARRLGGGHLDTRVELPRKDEFGVLAEAFNSMAARLAASTVSIENLENVFDSMAGTLIILNPDGVVTNTNRAAQSLLGYAPDELPGRPFQDIIAAPLGQSWRSVAQANDDGIVAVSELVLLAKDGAEVPVSLSGAELRPAEGTLRGYVCVAQDLTERKRAEERVRDSLAEKELLLREIHHRVKNNMQVISSLLALQASHASDPATARRFEESQSRIRSMALIHEQLYQSTDLARIDVRTYLEVLISHLSRSFDASGTVEVRVTVDDLSMDVDQSLACGLIVNELVANCFKHAFPDGQPGVVQVSLTEEPGGPCRLTVADDGPGPRTQRDVEPQRTLGTSLVRMLVKQLDGEMSVSAEGGHEVAISFPRRCPRGALTT